MKKIWIALLGSFLTVACGGGGGGTSVAPQSSPAPIFVSISPSATTYIDAGQAMKFTASVANDSSADGVSWSCSAAGSNGTGCGTFTNAMPTSATYNAPSSVTAPASVTVTATSIADGAKTGSALVGISPSLRIATASLATATVNAGYSTILQSSGGVAPLTWSLVSGSLPGGLGLQPGSGIISGTPTAAGNLSFTVAVKDSSTSPMIQNQVLSIEVNPGVQLAISTSILTNASPNTNYTATLQAVGGLPPFTWSLVSGALPTGLSLSSSGLISGDPTVPGDYTFTIQVADSNNSQHGGPSTAQVQLSLKVVTPIEIGSTSLPPGTQGAAYLEPVGVSGGTAPYNWQVIAGALPPGMGLEQRSGTISGVPQVAGNYSFQVKVTDSSPTVQSATQAFTLTIGVARPLTITTVALLDAAEGAPYEAMVAVEGGSPPYHWTIASGELPPNLVMTPATGAITGTPSVTGTSTFTVQVTDSSSTPQTQSQALSLAVNGGAEACTSSGNDAALTGQYAFNLSGFNGLGFITVVGSFSADGAGNLTGGEADANGVLGAQHGMIIASASSYSVGPDNRGCATLATSFGTFTAHFVLGGFSSATATTGKVIEWDAPSSSAYVAAGELALQDPTSFANGPSGGYVFRNIGWDPGEQGGREVCVGVVTVGGGALNDLEEDCNDAWNILSTAVPDVAGSLTPLDANGRATAIITTPQGNSNVVLYAVSSSELFAVNADSAPFASGIWIQQSAPAGGLGFTQASLNGNMVFYLNGLSLGGEASSVSIETASADGTSTLTINFYEDRAGVMQSSTPLTCTYAVEPSGRVYLSSDTGSCGGNIPVLYLSGVNAGFIMAASPGVDTGSIAPQMAGPFTGNSLAGNFIGGTAEIVSDGADAELEPVAPNGGGSIAGTTEISSVTSQDAATTFPASAYSVNSDGTFSIGSESSQVAGVIVSPVRFVMFSPSTLATSFPTLLRMQK